MVKIWLDDIRPAPDESWVHVRNFTEFRWVVELSASIHSISFDNDLGPREPEGWEIANWLRDEVLAGRVKPPRHLFVHSMNPVAAPRIKATLMEIKKHAQATASA